MKTQAQLLKQFGNPAEVAHPIELVFNLGTLTLTNSTLSGNSATEPISILMRSAVCSPTG